MANGSAKFCSSDTATTLAVVAGVLPGEDLKTVFRALEHPPKAPDWPSAIMSMLGAVALGTKGLVDAWGQPMGYNVLVVIAAALLAGAVAYRFVALLRTTDQLNLRAKELVQQAIAAQEAEAKRQSAPPG